MAKRTTTAATDTEQGNGTAMEAPPAKTRKKREPAEYFLQRLAEADTDDWEPIGPVTDAADGRKVLRAKRLGGELGDGDYRTIRVVDKITLKKVDRPIVEFS
jgi:hypothetical protein